MSVKILDIELKSHPPLDKKLRDLLLTKGVKSTSRDGFSLYIKFEGGRTIINALRRAINYELPIMKMSFKDSDFKTDDKNIIMDVVRRTILSSWVEQVKDLTFNLNIRNDTNMYKTFMFDSIVEAKGGEHFCPEKELVTLSPNTYLNIRKITMDSSTTACHKRSLYQMNGNIHYKILDNGNIEWYILPQRYIHPLYLIYMGIDNILNRVKEHTTLLKRNKSGIIASDTLELYQEKKRFKLKLHGESYTIPSLLELFIEPCVMDRVMDEFGYKLLILNTSNPIDELLKGFEKITTEFNNFKKLFDSSGVSI
jgi:hypothetical protein